MYSTTPYFLFRSPTRSFLVPLALGSSSHPVATSIFFFSRQGPSVLFFAFCYTTITYSYMVRPFFFHPSHLSAPTIPPVLGPFHSLTFLLWQGSTFLKPLLMPAPHKSKPAIGLSALSAIDTSFYAASHPSPSSHFGSCCPPTLPPTEVVPRLYLSDISAAESSSTLRALGITHVVSAMFGVVHLPHGVSIQQLQLPLQDNPFAELAEYLPRSTAFISDALRDPQARVLVHCVQGISRSTSIVCAYLIAHYGWTPAQAVQYIKSKRSLADPNPGFVSQLGEYAASLRGGHGSSSRGGGTGTRSGHGSGSRHRAV